MIIPRKSRMVFVIFTGKLYFLLELICREGAFLQHFFYAIEKRIPHPLG